MLIVMGWRYGKLVAIVTDKSVQEIQNCDHGEEFGLSPMAVFTQDGLQLWARSEIHSSGFGSQQVTLERAR